MTTPTDPTLPAPAPADAPTDPADAQPDPSSAASAVTPAEAAASDEPLAATPPAEPNELDTADNADTVEAAEATGADAAPPKKDLTPAECAAQLAERFPALFGAGMHKPLKLRVQADIQQRAPGVFSRRVLSHFLQRLTTSTAYIRALVDATQRFDLDGQPAGDVSDEHRDAAKTELLRRRELMAQRRAGERDAQRQRQRPAAPAPADGAAPTTSPNVTATDAPATDANAPPADRRPPRPPRPPRPQPGGPRRDDRGPREGAPRRDGAAPRDGRPPREGRPGPRPPHGGQPPQARRDEAPRREPRPADERHAPPRAPAVPLDPAQAERAALLRAFEASPLTPANFCALKRMPVAEFEAAIALARQERGPRR